MSDVITAIAHNAAGICQLGRDVAFTGQLDDPCRDRANVLLTVTTDEETLQFSLCRPHDTRMRELSSADEITLLVD